MRTQSHEYLSNYSGEHLAKSIELLFATTAESLRTDQSYNLNVKSALLDSFRIHARVVLFFLYAYEQQPDDVLAQHYMKADAIWKAIRPPRSEMLTKIQQRIGKEVTHLTYSRPLFAEEEPGWNMGHIAAELWMLLREFVLNSDPNKLHENVIESLERWASVFLRDGIFWLESSNYNFSMWLSSDEGRVDKA